MQLMNGVCEHDMFANSLFAKISRKFREQIANKARTERVQCSRFVREMHANKGTCDSRRYCILSKISTALENATDLLKAMHHQALWKCLKITQKLLMLELLIFTLSS